MSVPCVSVVMPMYNAVPFLDAAIRSILSQTLTDWELILVDAGSTDGSDGVLREHTAADQRLSVLRLPRSGIATALNHGLVAAKANLVAIMHADDEAMPERLERQVIALRARPNIVALGTAAETMEHDGRPIGRIASPSDPAEIRTKLLETNCLVHPTVMMRRDIVLAAGAYRRAFAVGEDYDLWLRLSEHHDLSNLPAVLLRHRTHDGQTNRERWLPHRLEVLAAQHAARLRRAGRPDPMQNHAHINAATLRAIGVHCDTISAALAGEMVGAPPLPVSAIAS